MICFSSSHHIPEWEDDSMSLLLCPLIHIIFELLFSRTGNLCANLWTVECECAAKPVCLGMAPGSSSFQIFSVQIKYNQALILYTYKLQYLPISD